MRRRKMSDEEKARNQKTVSEALAKAGTEGRSTHCEAPTLEHFR